MTNLILNERINISGTAIEETTSYNHLEYEIFLEKTTKPQNLTTLLYWPGYLLKNSIMCSSQIFQLPCCRLLYIEEKL